MKKKDQITASQSLIGLNLSETEVTENQQTDASQVNDEAVESKSHFKHGILRKIAGRKKLLTIGLMGVLSIGVLGAVDNWLGGAVLTTLAERTGIKEKSSTATETIPMPSGTLQLSKEYVYAGSRMLATEDYGIAQPNPTPTP